MPDRHGDRRACRIRHRLRFDSGWPRQLDGGPRNPDLHSCVHRAADWFGVCPRCHSDGLGLGRYSPNPAPEPGGSVVKLGRGELYTGRALLIGLMTITILPFISIFMTALHPSGTVPRGLEWPADPQ